MSEYPIIPLFPLAIVVLPGQTLPLHIFEPRYKRLIADCRAAERRGESLPFGISFGQDSAIHRDVGCSVVLEKVLNEYADGRLDIITVGRERYRIVEIYQEKPYLTAEVEFIEDEEEMLDPLIEEKLKVRYERLDELVEGESGAGLERPMPRGSFQLALATGLPLEVKQEMLEMRSENQRLLRLTEHLDELIPAMEKLREERHKVGSNGHTRKS